MEPSTNAVLQQLKKLSLEELMELKVATVYAASKREQKTTEAPASVSIVTSDDIQKFGHRTLADVLRSVRGFYVTYDRSYSYIGVRGVSRPGDYGGRVLVLINGHRLNDPIYNEAFNGGEFPLDMDLVDRVEVVRGPGHSLYGDNAFLAVINVVPKTGAQVNGWEASTTAASYDTYSGRLSYGTRTKAGLEFLLSGTFLDSGGHDRLHYSEFADVNNGVAEHLDGETVKQLFAALSYHDFSLSGFFGERHKDVPTAEYEAVFNQGPNFNRDQRWGLEAKFERDLGDDWHLLSRLFLDRYEYRGAGPYESEDPADPWVLNRDLEETWFWGAEAEVSRTFFNHHQLALGVDFRHDPEVRQRNWDYYDPVVLNVDAQSPTHEVGVYLQDEFAVRTNLTLSAAVRYDYFSSFGSTVNPRAGVIYQPVRDTTLKFLYAQAFRSPNAYERDYTIAGYVGNPRLQPERNQSYELIWEQAVGRHWRTSASLFLHDMTDFITPVQDDLGNFTFANLDAVRSRGAEVEVEGRWARGLSTRFSYTFADVQERSPVTGPGTPANSPRHLAKAALSIPLYQEKIFASLELQGLSSRLTVQDDEMPGFVTANLTLFSRELIKNLEISASLYNVFDRRYRDPVAGDFRQPAIEQDGRTFRVKLTYRF
ncbi:MAG: TonB-dependent receptor [Verrucomicrobia bacterium]|nr:TonB-dependent receptor [Verrucomicrobiota bacterium]